MIWNVEEWVLQARWQGHTGVCTDGKFGVNSDIYFSVGGDGNFNAWDPTNGVSLKQIAFRRFLWWVGVDGNGESITVANDDGSVRIIGLP